MPIYEYECKKCRGRTELLQKAKDKPLAKCPKCGGAVIKLISSPAIQFKGNGWYVTDYARKGSAAGSSGSGSKPEAKTGAGEAAKKKPEKATTSDS